MNSGSIYLIELGADACMGKTLNILPQECWKAVELNKLTTCMQTLTLNMQRSAGLPASVRMCVVVGLSCVQVHPTMLGVLHAFTMNAGIRYLRLTNLSDSGGVLPLGRLRW